MICVCLTYIDSCKRLLALTVVRAFFRVRSFFIFPPAARTLTLFSPPRKPRQLGAPQKHFWASLLSRKRNQGWNHHQLILNLNNDWRLKWGQVKEDVNSVSTRIFGTGSQTSAQFQPRRPWWWRTRLSAGRWPSTGVKHKLKSVISRLRNLLRAAVTVFPVYLLRLTVGFAAVVHKARAVALQRRVNDLRRHNKELKDFGVFFGQWHIWYQLTSLFFRAMK